MTTDSSAAAHSAISRRRLLGTGAALGAAAAVGSLVPDPASAAAAGPLGSVPDATGTSFRVWAPHGSAVHVSGTFNGWSESASPLTREPRGHWAGRVAGARPGDEYRYLIRNGDEVLSRRDPNGRIVTTATYGVGNTIIYDANAFDWGDDAGFQRRALDDLVIYELHIGTFSAPTPGVPGTFYNAIDRLDYLAALGVTAVELMPINESPGQFFGGYAPAEQFAVENLAYGGPDGLKSFVKAAHERGINVLLDIVHNHWGPWGIDVGEFDGWSTEEYPGGIYFFDEPRYESPWGPRPNYAQPHVFHYILDSVRMWLEEYHVDGFRWDSTSNIDHTNGGRGLDIPEGWRLMRSANRLQHRLAPGSISIAEDFLNRESLTAPLRDGGAGFDSQWHYFVSTVRSVLTAPTDAQRNLGAMTAAITSLYNDRALHRVVYSESHNETALGERLTVEIDPADPESLRAQKLSTLGASLAFTSPGVPMLWQGQEFLDPDSFNARRPMDWRRRSRYAGIVSLYRDLIAIHQNGGGVTAGLRGNHVTVFRQDDAIKLLAYHRWDVGGLGDDVVVVANFLGTAAVDTTVGFPRAGVWLSRFNSDDSVYSADFGGVGSASVLADGPDRQGMPTSGLVTIAPYSLLVLSQ